MGKLKIFIVAMVAMGFLITPLVAMGGGYPKGDNSWAIVGVPKGWAPKVEGNTSGSSGKKFPKGENSWAIVGVPKGWAPSTDAGNWGSSGSIKSRTKGNTRAIVGVPGPWAPK